MGEGGDGKIGDVGGKEEREEKKGRNELLLPIVPCDVADVLE